MKRHLAVFGTLLLIAGVAVLITAAPGQGKESVAVMKFTVTAGAGASYWRSASWDLGKGMAEMMTTALLETGKFRVLERQQIQDVVGEQDFGDSGRVDPTTAAKGIRMPRSAA